MNIFSQDLSERFSLTPDQAGFGLTAFSTKDTILASACPKGGPCSKDEKFRSLDGECNNLENPLWGKVSHDNMSMSHVDLME